MTECGLWYGRGGYSSYRRYLFALALSAPTMRETVRRLYWYFVLDPAITRGWYVMHEDGGRYTDPRNRWSLPWRVTRRC